MLAISIGSFLLTWRAVNFWSSTLPPSAFEVLAEQLLLLGHALRAADARADLAHVFQIPQGPLAVEWHGCDLRSFPVGSKTVACHEPTAKSSDQDCQDGAAHPEGMAADKSDLRGNHMNGPPRRIGESSRHHTASRFGCQRKLQFGPLP